MAHWLSRFRDLHKRRIGTLIGWRGRRLVERAVLRASGLGPQQGRLVVRAEPGTASLFAVGDIGLHCFTDTQDDWRSQVSGLYEEMQSCSLRVGNLESLLTSVPVSYPGTIVANPRSIEWLRVSGINAVTIANNHVFDAGQEGLAESLSILRASGISVCGVGSTARDAHAPVKLEAGGLAVGMLGYTDDFNLPAPDSVSLAMAIECRMVDDISRLRKQVDLLIVQAHWGFEWVLHPLLFYRDLARRCIEAGADLVLCHHAHVPMAVERWNQGIVAHGLGNLVFGWKERAHPWCDISLGIRVSFSRLGVHSAEIVPIEERAGHHLTPCVGWRRREVLGGLSLMAGALGEEDFLMDLQNRLVVAEASSVVRMHERALRSGDQRRLDLARSRFTTPRTKLVASHLGCSGQQSSEALCTLIDSLITQERREDAGFLDALHMLKDRVEESGRLP